MVPALETHGGQELCFRDDFWRTLFEYFHRTYYGVFFISVSSLVYNGCLLNLWAAAILFLNPSQQIFINTQYAHPKNNGLISNDSGTPTKNPAMKRPPKTSKRYPRPTPPSPTPKSAECLINSASRAPGPPIKWVKTTSHRPAKMAEAVACTADCTAEWVAWVV